MGFVYKFLLKPVFFRFNPESVHNFFIKLGRIFGRSGFLRLATASFCDYSHPSLETKVLGISFKNPVGLAAGFDKNALLLGILPSVGFGFAEIGSITALPCPGNPKPRLWRLPKDKAIAVHYGLANDGAEVIAKRFEENNTSFPFGVSIAKTNLPSILGIEGIEDYARSFSMLYRYGDYITVNVSCPNAPDGREFCEPEPLQMLLDRLDKFEIKKPIFLKIKPDLLPSEFDAILEVCGKYPWLKGFVISNLTHNYGDLKTDKGSIESQKVRGGLSGGAVKELSDKLLGYAYMKTKKKYILVGCGGIFSGDDAYNKIRLGASLVQLITGMIYEGPTLIKRINQRLVELMKRDGFRNISDAVGAAYK